MSRKPFADLIAGGPGDFAEEVRIAAEHQVAGNPFYRAVCQARDWSVAAWNGDPATVPAITVGTFKSSFKAGRWLLMVPLDEVACWMVSSETTGEVSLVGRTARDVEFMQAAYAHQTLHGLRAAGVTRLYGFNPTAKFLRQITMRSVGRRLEGKPVLPQAVFATEAVGGVFDLRCLLVLQADGRLGYDEVALERALRQAEARAQPVALGGSPQLLYLRLVAWQRAGIRFDLPRAWIVTGQGGWSGRKARLVEGGVINKRAFIELAQEVFGLSAANVRDMYGLTESPGLCQGRWDGELGDFVFRPPAWMRVYVVGLDLQPVESGEIGLLTIVVPYGIEGYPGLSILTDDLVQKVAEQAFVYQRRSEGDWNRVCAPMSEVKMLLG